jgi:hypothetical protein
MKMPVPLQLQSWQMRVASAVLVVIGPCAIALAVGLMRHPVGESRTVDVVMLLLGMLWFAGGVFSFAVSWLGWKAPWETKR